MKNSFKDYCQKVEGLVRYKDISVPFDIRQVSFGYTSFLTPEECAEHIKKVAKEKKKEKVSSPQLTLF